MKILEDPHQDPQRSLHRSLKILKDLKKIFTRERTRNTPVLVARFPGGEVTGYPTNCPWVSEHA